MKIYTLTTFNDWVAFYGTWGEPGIEKVFDVLKISRIERVYWRAFDGGLANYPSRVAQRFDGSLFTDETTKGEKGGPHSFNSYKPVRNDKWDALAAAVRVGHRRGIEVCAWFTVYEEDHGGNLGSRFSGRADILQQDRKGRVHPGAIELFFKEVQDYKLAIVRELLARGVDGVMLDFVRHNATPSADESGVHRFGYNPEIRRAFQREDGRDPLAIRSDDPAWLGFKNRYQTDFVRRIRHLIGKQRRMDLLLWNVDNPRWLCLDVPSLTREKRVDMIASFPMTYSLAPKMMKAQYQTMQSQIRGSHTEAAPGLPVYFGIDPEEFEEAVAAAEEAGAKSVLLCESHHLIGCRLATSARAIQLGCPRRRREIAVRRLSHLPTERDWNGARRHKGFFILEGADKVFATAKTEFSLLRSPGALHCRLIAHGKQDRADFYGVYRSKRDPHGKDARHAVYDPIKAKKVYLDALGARMYWIGADRGHLFLDVGRTRRQFTHFVIGLNGDLVQETNLDNAWRVDWNGRAKRVSPSRWVAEWTLPFASLGASPRKGDRWGFQIVREHAVTHEVSCWFVSTSPACDGLRSYEWGDLVFE